MHIIKTNIDGPLILEPKVFYDPRGYFFESWTQRGFEDNVGKVHFVQDNESKSVRGVIRGLHFQSPPFAQSKLVRCVLGSVLDVIVDIRKESPTYGEHLAIELTDENHRQLYVPKGFAHGFAVLSDVAIFQYKCDNYYAPQSEGGISLLDESLGIDWRVPIGEAIISEKDRTRPTLSELESPF